MPHSYAPEPLPALPRIGLHTALFLDFDGTLVDIAPQPEAVQVPPGLVDTLAGLAAQLNGALAIVSGRRLSDLDGFLAPLQLCAAAEHGAQQRLPGGQILQLASPDLHEVSEQANALAARHKGLQVEIKSASVALHYRQAPELEAQCLQVMAEAAQRLPGTELLRGKSVVEVKPAGINKGTALQAFMALPPFAGRVPLFAGDDQTDETGFSVMRHLGGEGIKVGDGPTLADHRCNSPAELRQWLLTALENASSTALTSPAPSHTAPREPVGNIT